MNANRRAATRLRGGRSSRVRSAGFLIMDAVVSLVVIGMAAAAVVQTLSAAAESRRETERRQAALVEADNMLERLMAAAWSDLVPDKVAAWPLSGEAQRALPAGRLAIQVEPTADEPAGRRLAVTVAWAGPGGVVEHSVQRVAWRFARLRGASP